MNTKLKNENEDRKQLQYNCSIKENILYNKDDLIITLKSMEKMSVCVSGTKEIHSECLKLARDIIASIHSKYKIVHIFSMNNELNELKQFNINHVFSEIKYKQKIQLDFNIILPHLINQSEILGSTLMVFVNYESFFESIRDYEELIQDVEVFTHPSNNTDTIFVDTEYQHSIKYHVKMNIKLDS